MQKLNYRCFGFIRKIFSLAKEAIPFIIGIITWLFIPFLVRFFDGYYIVSAIFIVFIIYLIKKTYLLQVPICNVCECSTNEEKERVIRDIDNIILHYEKLSNLIKILSISSLMGLFLLKYMFYQERVRYEPIFLMAVCSFLTSIVTSIYFSCEMAYYQSKRFQFLHEKSMMNESLKVLFLFIRQSKSRIVQCLCFIIGLWGAIIFLVTNYPLPNSFDKVDTYVNRTLDIFAGMALDHRQRCNEESEQHIINMTSGLRKLWRDDFDHMVKRTNEIKSEIVCADYKDVEYKGEKAIKIMVEQFVELCDELTQCRDSCVDDKSIVVFVQSHPDLIQRVNLLKKNISKLARWFYYFDQWEITGLDDSFSHHVSRNNINTVIPDYYDIWFSLQSRESIIAFFVFHMYNGFNTTKDISYDEKYLLCTAYVSGFPDKLICNTLREIMNNAYDDNNLIDILQKAFLNRKNKIDIIRR